MSVPEGVHYNPYMDGGMIKMAAPLHEDGVTYQDGTKATIGQQAHDVVSFLQWAAEPEMEQRKSMGIHVMLFLGIMTCFFYLVKKRVWSNLH
jgi:ubiquinol-cytochrome c reductase cytochrome c1 subunit